MVAHSVLQISPTSWRRTKIFECISTGGTTVFTGPYGLDMVASPIINSKALADDNVVVSVRTQGLPTVIPPTVQFDSGGTNMIVDMPASATAYITLSRPHTSTR